VIQPYLESGSGNVRDPFSLHPEGGRSELIVVSLNLANSAPKAYNINHRKNEDAAVVNY
jgi:hypothetical protein